MKRFTITLILAALMLVSCSETKNPDETKIESAEPSAEQLALFSGYSLVRPDICDKAVVDATIEIRNKLGLETISTDWVKRDENIPEDNVEFLIGETNRKASVDALAELTNYRGNYTNDFIIRMKDNKIVITGGSPSAVASGADYFLKNVLPAVDAATLSDFEFISRREYEVETINGVSAGDYTIYIPKEASDETKALAEELKALILEKTGFVVPISDRDTGSTAGIWLGVDYGEGGKALDSLTSYRKNCGNDWLYSVKDGNIVAVGVDESAMKLAINKFKENMASIFGASDNSEFIYRKDYKMIELAGRNIGEYSILLPENNCVDINSAAKRLKATIYELTGFDLPIVTEPGEYNIRLGLYGDQTTGSVRFDGNDLVISGGHYVSAAGAANEFISSLSTNAEYKSDYTISETFDKVPLVSERYPEMTLVWNDEFDYDGDLYDRDKWLQRAQMNASDMYNSETERNVKTEDGNLVLRSWKEEDTSISEGKPYSTNKSMTTRDSCNFCYGYLEMRAKVPFGKGCWPSFWMVQREDMHNEGVNWMAEIDIFEVFGSKDKVVPNIHKWYNSTADNYHVQLGDDRKTPYVFKDTSNLSDEYHTYGFYWDEEKMVFSVDGEDYCTMDITEKTGDFGKYKGMDGFHTPGYIILNNFLFTPEASWIPDGAMVDDNMEYPVTYTIDYIRLYQGDNGEMYSPELGETRGIPAE